jgi:hypothetical protein
MEEPPAQYENGLEQVNSILDYVQRLEAETSASSILNYFVDNNQFTNNTKSAMPRLTLSEDNTESSIVVDFLMVVSTRPNLALLFIDDVTEENDVAPLPNSREEIVIQFKEIATFWKNKFIHHVNYHHNTYLFATLKNPLDQIFLVFSKEDNTFEPQLKLPREHSRDIFISIVLPFLDRLKNEDGSGGTNTYHLTVDKLDGAHNWRTNVFDKNGARNGWEGAYKTFQIPLDDFRDSGGNEYTEFDVGVTRELPSSIRGYFEKHSKIRVMYSRLSLLAN